MTMNVNVKEPTIASLKKNLLDIILFFVLPDISINGIPVFKRLRVYFINSKGTLAIHEFCNLA